MRTGRRRQPILAAGLAGSLLILTAGAAVGQDEAETTVTIRHGSVVDGTVYLDLGAPGPSVGDVRAFSVEATDDAGRAGRLTATLTTTGSDWPSAGDELRLADIVMAFGDGLADQLVITGAALYPADSSTLIVGDPTVRPIGGGSGLWNGARGYVESIHLADDTWEHIFHLLP